jgi:hypothetical protein
MYYILKQFVPNADIWVIQLTPEDTIYSYNTVEEANAALPEVQLLYPNNLCKVS